MTRVGQGSLPALDVVGEQGERHVVPAVGGPVDQVVQTGEERGSFEAGLEEGRETGLRHCHEEPRRQAVPRVSETMAGRRRADKVVVVVPAVSRPAGVARRKAGEEPPGAAAALLDRRAMGYRVEASSSGSREAGAIDRPSCRRRGQGRDWSLGRRAPGPRSRPGRSPETTGQAVHVSDDNPTSTKAGSRRRRGSRREGRSGGEHDQEDPPTPRTCEKS